MDRIACIPFYWVLIFLFSGWIGGTCLGLILGQKKRAKRNVIGFDRVDSADDSTDEKNGSH